MAAIGTFSRHLDTQPPSWRSLPHLISTDLGILIVLALARLLLHLVTNGHYGFHRDELAVLDDAKQLTWGYVAYPPFTPFIARLALTLFGASLVGLRLFSAGLLLTLGDTGQAA